MTLSESLVGPPPDALPLKLKLPHPQQPVGTGVQAWEEPVEIFTFLPAQADPNPMFLQKRVYQGSRGEVYPLPFIDRIDATGAPRQWKAIHIENRYLRLMILPEIGGRIHVGLDKTNDYDFFYRQNVIKPALVGLAGPWISGGVEFNWPQHHRPATFMPVDTEIETHVDGSVTVWCSDYDRATGMKGMHGVCLHPERSVVELKVRLYNCTERMQTFLWWANVAARVHEHYQSFFPSDVHYVADHAKRAVSSFPLADATYYGVDFGARGRSGIPADELPTQFIPAGYPPNDLSRYANIPVPTSYMIVNTKENFFGGYDHHARAGFVHVANHHIAPGKKQWTWGNHEFGYAWDRCLTENDGPYVELMAGVYTDNQPDFSFLAPGETKSFSQFWYPLRKTGVPIAANIDAAIGLEMDQDVTRIALCVTCDLPSASIVLNGAGKPLAQWHQTLTVETPFNEQVKLLPEIDPATLEVIVAGAAGQVILKASIKPRETVPEPALAVEPPAPDKIATVDLLFLTGLHLEQYRHATRSPEPYWLEGLRRDPGDTRCNHALGKLHLQRGEYKVAEDHLRVAIQRATQLNPNPYDGEVYYSLGLTLRRQNRLEEAYAAFYKCTWNAAWRSAGYHALAEIDVVRDELKTSLDHLKRSLSTNTDNLDARNLCVSVMRRLGLADAAAMLAETRAMDPLDLWSRYLDRVDVSPNGHALLSLGLLLERSGQYYDAITILKHAATADQDGSRPLVFMTLSRCYETIGEADSELYLEHAAQATPTYCFPSGIDHLDLLEYAIARRPAVDSFHTYLGNLLFHHRRHDEAVREWQESVRLNPGNAQAWRNLGIASFNLNRDTAAAQHAFDCALEASPSDARLMYERDQLQKRLGSAPSQRLAVLLHQSELVQQRDDLSVELATLLNQLERPAEALHILLTRHFQPWEGGEGLVLAQYTTAHMKLAQTALEGGNPQEAIGHLIRAQQPPHNLGEAKHLLANDSDIHYWLGEAYAAANDFVQSRNSFERSASLSGDFQGMSLQAFSEMSYWSGVSLQRLGRRDEADQLFESLLQYSYKLEKLPATIDYFATSLPALLLFEDDLQSRAQTRAQMLRAAALQGLGKGAEAKALISQVLKVDPNCTFAIDLLRHATDVDRSPVSR